MTYKIKYNNNSVELLFRGIAWCLGFILIIPIPWVINDQLKYFSRGFTVTSSKKTS